MSRHLSLVTHALAGWAVCGATVAIGRLVVSMETTLLVHAIVAPVAFALLTWHYCRRHPQARAGHTALVMIAIVVGMDALVVAPIFERSYAMFGSALGTWVPLASSAAASYLTARGVRSMGARPTSSGA